jgi:uncharacterized membrane protein
MNTRMLYGYMVVIVIGGIALIFSGAVPLTEAQWFGIGAVLFGLAFGAFLWARRKR